MTQDPKVDAYIAKSAPFAQPILNHLRALVHETLPGLDEALKWGMPHFIYKGKNLAGIAAFKAHCGFYPMDPVLLERFAPELTGFKTAKGTIQFTPDQPVPADLILRIVAARLEQDQAKGGRRG